MLIRGHEIARSFPFAGGQLVLFTRRQPRLKSYQEPKHEAGARLLFFAERQKKARIHQIADLAHVGTRGRADVRRDIENDIVGFAQLICDYMAWGHVVRDVERYAYLRDDRGIDLAKHGPQMMGQELRFMSARFDLSDKSPHLLDVAIDLDSFEFTAKDMPSRDT